MHSVSVFAYTQREQFGRYATAFREMRQAGDGTLDCVQYLIGALRTVTPLDEGMDVCQVQLRTCGQQDFRCPRHRHRPPACRAGV